MRDIVLNSCCAQDAYFRVSKFALRPWTSSSCLKKGQGNLGFLESWSFDAFFRFENPLFSSLSSSWGYSVFRVLLLPEGEQLVCMEPEVLVLLVEPDTEELPCSVEDDPPLQVLTPWVEFRSKLSFIFWGELASLRLSSSESVSRSDRSYSSSESVSVAESEESHWNVGDARKCRDSIGDGLWSVRTRTSEAEITDMYVCWQFKSSLPSHLLTSTDCGLLDLWPRDVAFSWFIDSDSGWAVDESRGHNDSGWVSRNEIPSSVEPGIMPNNDEWLAWWTDS